MIHTIEECAILSNCARMDVLLCLKTTIAVIDTDTDTDTNKNRTLGLPKGTVEELAQGAAQQLVANCLMDQLFLYQNARQGKGNTATLWEGISSFLDLPGMIIVSNGEDSALSTSASISRSTTPMSISNNDNDNDNDCEYNTAEMNEKEQSTNILEMAMKTTWNVDEITQHFCLVAAGLAKKDSRPDRIVTFRPFSSPDAHIMLQIKRTAEVAMQYPKVKIILNTALNAGKGTRDVKKVPILNQLKKYDCEGKYSTPTP